MLGVLAQELLRQTGGLPAEDQVILRRKAGLSVKPRPLRFHKPQTCAVGNLLLKGRPAWPAIPFDVLPVIHPGARDLRVVQLEPEWLNQVQDAAGGGDR